MHFGRELQSRLIGVLLSVVQQELSDLASRYGPNAPLIEGEYDYVTEQDVEFSAYSPPEVPRERRLTWHIVKVVINGLVDLLILQKRHREVSFTIREGTDHAFVGYGHLVQDRSSNKS